MARPTHGNCTAVVALDIIEGHHGNTRLDGLKAVAMLAWPGAIHEGRAEALIIVDELAKPDQRESLLRILSGQDTEPGATIFEVFSATFERTHEPMFRPIASYGPAQFLKRLKQCSDPGHRLSISRRIGL